MICPECKAEYRDGFTVCADCDVALVAQLSTQARSAPANDQAAPDESETFAASDPDDPFCEFWKGEDPRICADICSVLDDAGIPHRVLRHEANLFRISANSHIKIGVPFSLYEKAENAIGDAFGGAEEAHRLLRPSEPNRPQFAALVRQSLKAKWRQETRRSPFFSWDSSGTDPQEADEPAATEQPPTRRPESGEAVSKEQLTQEVWRGAAVDTGDFIATCLKENSIPFLSAMTSEDMRIFVSATDAAHAREIVREVADATPPS